METRLEGVMISKVWAVDGSVSCHCCFDESILIFDEAVTEEYAIKRSWDGVKYRNVIETLEIDHDDLDAVVRCLRSIYDK
jgi:hypothetical protein